MPSLPGELAACGFRQLEVLGSLQWLQKASVREEGSLRGRLVLAHWYNRQLRIGFPLDSLHGAEAPIATR